VCAYDTDIYRVLTLKIKNRFLWMYAYLCNIGMVCIVVTGLYYLTKTQFLVAILQLIKSILLVGLSLTLISIGC